MLKLEHIKKSYDGVNILNDINLEIADGEIVSILGRQKIYGCLMADGRWGIADFLHNGISAREVWLR